MPARLVPLTPGSAPIVLLQKPILLIGRHDECDVRFDLPSISRRHCCVAVAYDRITIRDLGSRHGIRVNGEVLEERRLRSGDEIAIGPLLFRFEDEASPPPAPSKPARKKKPDEAAKPAIAAEAPLDDDDDGLVPLSGRFPLL
jgi:pSer/pThr/pTyr-binding forkhead associated (FHA) protein